MHAHSMRSAAAPALASCCLLISLTGCSKTYVQSDTTLGRVVVYRNGVAYFERSALLEDDHLQMTVPDQQLDDFLKSLSVHDAATGELAPVSYRTNSAGSIDLDVKLPGPKPHRIKLSYVTEAPAWKPSYRVTLGAGKTVKFQAWAIVDNTTGEDWNGVRLGVSSGSALSFRYDLRSVRNVARDRLEPEGLVAPAPPNGGAAYGKSQDRSAVVASLDGDALAKLEGEAARESDPARLTERMLLAKRVLAKSLAEARAQKDVVKTLCLSDKLAQLGAAERLFSERSRTDPENGAVLTALAERADQLTAEANQCIGEELAMVAETRVTTAQTTPEDRKAKLASKKGPMGGDVGSDTRATAQDPSTGKKPETAAPPADNAAAQLVNLEQRVAELKERVFRDRARVRLLSSSVLGGSIEDASRRGELVKNRLVRAGIPADRVIVDARQAEAGQAASLAIVTESLDAVGAAADVAPGSVATASKPSPSELAPVESSMFELPKPMDVPHNSSVMLALYGGETPGEAVYYYDAESPRGDANFPFRAVRLKNPTSSTLESGPVSVVSEGRFLGEGVSDPIPPGSFAFVPFALDRLIVAERNASESDAVARIISVRRGVFTTEVRHSRVTHVKLFNRSGSAASVYIRHKLAPGYTLTHGPVPAEKLGGAELYRVDVAAHASREVEIVESTSARRSTDIKDPEGAKLLAAYVEGAEVDPGLERAVTNLGNINAEIGKLQDELSTKRDQQREYRDRLHELHAEVVTLKTVKSSGGLLADLEKKLAEMSDRVSKSTSDIVALEEKIMVARVRMQDALGELHFDHDEAKPSAGAVSKR